MTIITSKTTQATRAIAQRIVNAHLGFQDVLVEIAGIERLDAERVTNFYLTKKLAKLDPVGGRISVKHGAYLDRAAILAAVEQSKVQK